MLAALRVAIDTSHLLVACVAPSYLRHLPQAHLLVMSLNVHVAKCNLGKVKLKSAVSHTSHA